MTINDVPLDVIATTLSAYTCTSGTAYPQDILPLIIAPLIIMGMAIRDLIVGNYTL